TLPVQRAGHSPEEAAQHRTGAAARQDRGQDPQFVVHGISLHGPVGGHPANLTYLGRCLHGKAPSRTERGESFLMPEVYVSTDVETDGPIPGPHSLLSFSSAAYLADKTLVGTFSANLETLPGASGHPQTMAWWQTQPEAWAAARSNPQDPA